MKKLLWIPLVALLAVSCDTAGTGGNATLTTFEDSVSYAFGMNLGTSATVDSIQINPDLIAQGIRDKMASDSSQLKLTDEQVQSVMSRFQQEMMAKQQERQQQKVAASKAREEAFLAENKQKEGVMVTSSGLQYEVIEAGSGESPDTNDMVQVKYRGTLLDGTEFDSSGDTPVQFQVNQIILGWQEALQLMKPGAKWKLYIPADLAYGAFGQGNTIGPNETLIFDVELVSVEKQ